ncbi:hypothetical protein D9M73_189860 [compost metagenome]
MHFLKKGSVLCTDDSLNQLLLGTKIPVQGASRDVGTAGHVIDRKTFGALGNHRIEGGTQDQRPAITGVFHPAGITPA